MLTTRAGKRGGHDRPLNQANGGSLLALLPNIICLWGPSPSLYLLYGFDM